MPLRTFSLQKVLVLEDKTLLLCQIRDQNLCKIFKQIRILISKECKKLSKMSCEIEVGEAIFAYLYSQLQTKVARRVSGKRGLGVCKKALAFCFCYAFVIVRKRDFAKFRLAKFRYIKREKFILHLKKFN